MEIDFITKTLNELLEKFGIDFELDVVEDADIKATRFLIKTNTPNILIGYRGGTLSALGHVVKRIVDKHFCNKDKHDRLYFIVDVNDYYGEKIEELKTNARMLAARAKYFNSSVDMPPLPPYERMIVHALFADSEEFATQSKGEREHRCVVITYMLKS